MAGSSGKGVSVIQVGGIHGGRLYPHKVLLIVEEESDGTVAEKELVQGVVWNDDVILMEL